MNDLIQKGLDNKKPWNETEEKVLGK